MLAYPQNTGSEPDVESYDDPYDFESYDDYGDDFGDEADVPAGLPADDYDDTEDDEDAPGSPTKEWLVLGAQVTAAVLGGGVVWLGFRWLWIANSWAALGAALAVTACLVLIARKFMRSDDLQTILLAVLAGLFCTVSPAALLLVGH
jgi:hypothetical protein